jgi:hypothetical protein
VTSYCLNFSSDHIIYIQPDRTNFPLHALETCAIAHVQPTEHTMGYALPPYVLGKVPTQYIYKAAQDDVRFVVWGIFDTHVIPYAWERGYIAKPIEISSPSTKKKANAILNHERPKLFHCTPRKDIILNQPLLPFYLLSVFPGNDYVYHYGRMVHQGLEMMRHGSALTLLEVRTFPKIQKNISVWTCLDQIPIQDGDIVLMGHVADYFKCLLRQDQKKETPLFLKSETLDETSNLVPSPGPSINQILQEQFNLLSDCITKDLQKKFLTILEERQKDFNWTNYRWDILQINPDFKTQNENLVLIPPGTPKTKIPLPDQEPRVAPTPPPETKQPDQATGDESPPAAAPKNGSSSSADEICQGCGSKGHLRSACTNRVNIKRIFLLGARYSYWGDIVRYLAQTIYTKTRCLVYSGKCGTMISEKNIETITIPKEFVIVKESKDSRDCNINILKYRYISRFPTFPFPFSHSLPLLFGFQDCGLHI